MRNTSRKFYAFCLAIAAHLDRDLSCDGCRHATAEPAQIDAFEIACCEALILAAEKPDAYYHLGARRLIEYYMDGKGRFEEFVSIGSRKSRGEALRGHRRGDLWLSKG